MASGDVAEWLGGGLQNLVQRFKSARRLQFLFHCLGGGTVRRKGLRILQNFGIIVSKSKVWYHSEPDNIKAHTSIYDLEVHR